MWALGSTPSSFHFRWTSSGNICGEEESLGVCEPLMFRYLKSYSRAFTVISKSRQNFRTSHFNMFEFGDLNKKVLAQTGRHSRRGWIKGNHQMLWRTKVQFEIENWKAEFLNFFNKQQSYPIAQILNKQNSNCCSRISEIVYLPSYFTHQICIWCGDNIVQNN